MSLINVFCKAIILNIENELDIHGYKRYIELDRFHRFEKKQLGSLGEAICGGEIERITKCMDELELEMNELNRIIR